MVMIGGIYGGIGNDMITGWNDISGGMMIPMVGRSGDDTIDGNNGNDIISGDYSDMIITGGNDDTINGNDGNDIICQEDDGNYDTI